jgi:hypothetical protein
VIRIRIVQTPSIQSIDGIRLDCFALGAVYEVGNTLGALFLAEGWADPLSLDSNTPAVPFEDGESSRGPDQPRNLIRETHPYLQRADTVADFTRRRRPRK